MDAKLIEHLLHEEEGVHLDFKRDQYAFRGADVHGKSELLKDILSFVNAWRRSTAYILIGVEEIKGARSKAVGVSTQLNDADLQQFVNSKTQRPVHFAYRAVHFDSVDIGIIEIPIQQRPVYVDKTFGKVKQGEVYLRRGSSTATVLPDEIAKMGIAMGDWGSTGAPQLVLEWADIDGKTIVPSPSTVRSLILEPLLPDKTFAPAESIKDILLFDPALNPYYSRELIGYVAKHSFFQPLGLWLHNDSEVTGRRIRFVGSISKFCGVEIRNQIGKLPSPQRGALSIGDLSLSIRRPGEADTYPTLKEYDDRWEVTIDFGDIRPQESIWSSGSIFVGSRNSVSTTLEGKLLGDNIRRPISCVLAVTFEVERRAMEVEDVTPHLIVY